MKICLTGGIACGKSLLSRYLNELGVETIDADDIVHELIPDPAERRRIAAEVFADPAKRKALEAKIHPIVKERIEAFLDNGFNSDAGKGLSLSSSSSATLNEQDRFIGGGVAPTLLEAGYGAEPHFKNKVQSQVKVGERREASEGVSRSLLLPSELRTKTASLRLAIIPLLFETHWNENYDIICAVVSEKETQIARMMTTRGYSRLEAEARLAAQMPVEEKAKRSHYVIHNDGSPEELKEETRKFVDWLCQKTSMSLPGR